MNRALFLLLFLPVIASACDGGEHAPAAVDPPALTLSEQPADVNAASVAGAPAVTPRGFPRFSAFAIGSGTDTAKWSQTSEGSQTAITASHDVACLNFIYPNDDDGSTIPDGVANLRHFNSDLILGHYVDASAINNSGYDQTKYRPTLESYVIRGTNGASDGDGLTRDSAGNAISPGYSKQGVNWTTFTGLVNDRYAQEYLAEQRYLETFTSATGAKWDFIYWDVSRWIPLEPEVGVADWNMDNTAEDRGNFDGKSDPNAIAIGIVKKRAADRVSALFRAEYGKELVHAANTTSNWDWYAGARADTGPAILTGDSQPIDWMNWMRMGHLEWWNRISGYNDDGTPFAGGNFERGFKAAARHRDAMQINPLTGDKFIVLNTIAEGTEFQSVSTDQERWARGRYYTAIASVIGVDVSFERQETHKELELLDEYVAGDVRSMTVAQVRANAHWLGQPIGGHPDYDDKFVQGVHGGVIFNARLIGGKTGVYGMEFENGMVFVNPKDNPHSRDPATVDVPAGNWTRFRGAQDPDVNDGSPLGATLRIAEGEALFVGRVRNTDSRVK